MVFVLPQDDSNKPARAGRLAQKQKDYEYDEYLPNRAMLKRVPRGEGFSAKYVVERVAASADIVTNALATQVHQVFDPLDELADYEDYFKTIKLPAVAKVFQTDDSFAEQRLSGANPLALRLLKATDPRAVVLQSLQSPGFDVAAELAKGNVYFVDFTGTDPEYRGPSLVQGGTYGDGKKKKYLPKPLAYFRWASGKLVPVAIQLVASSDPKVYKPSGGRVYTPAEASKNDWLFAKICVQIADANHHEMSTHLGRTHFVYEPYGIATARQLDDTHPISILLRIHMRFHLSNNNLAHTTLLAKGGPIDTLLAGTLDESLAMSGEACDTWDLKKHAFKQDIKDRGLDDTSRLPHYPFRDDGTLIWDASEQYVTAYVAAFYDSDAKIVGDTELQAWAKELSDPVNGGRVKGMPSAITTRAELVSILTTVIFTCGPQHSAVNFSQFDYMCYVPSMALSGYSDVSAIAARPEPITDKDILELLPPHAPTASQLVILKALTAYYFDSYGNYDKTLKELYHGGIMTTVFKAHPHAAKAIQVFQDALKKVETTIADRNVKRAKTNGVGYEFMLPSKILNSTSI